MSDVLDPITEPSEDVDELEEMPPCAHCQSELKGYAGINGDLLCHPDYGIDCYRLVTLYRHPMPCPHCRDARLLLDGMDPQFAGRQ